MKMMNDSTLITLIGVLFSIVTCENSIGQAVDLVHIHRFQPAVAFALYEPAKGTSLGGDMEMNNLPNFGLKLGFEYDFRPGRDWSLVTGVLFTKQPVMNVRFNIDEEDIGPIATADVNERMRVMSPLFFQIPLAIRRHVRLNDAKLLEFRLGSFFQYLPDGFYNVAFNYGPPDGSNVQLFALNANSPNSDWQIGLTMTTGITLIKENCIIKLLGTYHIYQRDIIFGEYAFQNLQFSGPSFGTYRLSGNHFALTGVFSWIRDKYRIRP